MNTEEAGSLFPKTLLHTDTSQYLSHISSVKMFELKLKSALNISLVPPAAVPVKHSVMHVSASVFSSGQKLH